jgi:prepilin-type N-terminal cleavage/methylation domain-containing protein
MRNSRFLGPAGVTLPELLITLTVIGTLTTLGASGFRNLRDATSMRAATWSVRNHLVLARSLAIARREKIRIRQDESGDLVLLTLSGERVAAASVGPSSDVPVDSLRVRPSTLRFNSRGQAAPGSVYLYRGDRVVRVVSNFLGRLRIESYRAP